MGANAKFSALITKSALKFGIELKSPSVANSLTVDIDTENDSQTYTVTGSNTLVWKNNGGVVISWTNNLSNLLTWLAVGYIFEQRNVESVGNYLGATVTTSTPGNNFIGMHLQYEPRTPWTTVPDS